MGCATDCFYLGGTRGTYHRDLAPDLEVALLVLFVGERSFVVGQRDDRPGRFHPENLGVGLDGVDAALSAGRAFALMPGVTTQGRTGSMCQ